jgi:outer membrane protein assembly factor BamB
MCHARHVAWFSTVCSISMVVAAGARADNWPQFRGPTGQGLSDEKNLPVTWGGQTREHVLWESPLIGEGHASPIVWDNHVFVSTARWPDEPIDKAEVIPEHHLLCYQTDNGRLVWDTRIPPGPWKRSDFRSGAGGGYAAPTPATDGQRVFCAYGSSVLASVGFDGRVVWRKELVPHTFDVTLGSSPVLFGDTVILLHAMANKADSQVVAYRKRDGEIHWQQPLATTGFGHSTPLLISAGGRRQLLILASGMSTTADALLSVDPASGRKLWWCRGAGDAASPAYGAGIVYFDNGRGGPGVAVDPTGEGDVTATRIHWTISQVPEAISSPIIVSDLVYRLHAPGVLRCWQVEDGKQLYTQRLEGISSTWASPVADGDGHMLFATAGKSFVIQAGRDYKLLATNDLGDPNHASPAIANGRVFLVGTKNIYCIGHDTGN